MDLWKVIFIEELFFQRKVNPEVMDPTYDVRVRGELISREQCIASTDGMITEEWIRMDSECRGRGLIGKTSEYAWT